VPLIHFNSKALKWIQDFIAPFYLFTKAEYTSHFKDVDSLLEPSEATLVSSVEARFLNVSFRKINFEIETKYKRIHQFSFLQNGIKKTYICTI